MQNNKQLYHKLQPIKGEKIIWDNLYGSSVGLTLSALVANSPLLVITPDVLSSLRLAEELRFFLGSKGEASDRIKLFPGWEILPYDHFSPYEDIISERLSLLYQLTLAKKPIILVDAKTLMHKLPPRNYIETNSFVVKVGENIDFETLRRKFINQGYISVTKVMEHGEFAIRGSIVDVFPMGSSLPYRLDFFDTEIDSIRIFDVDTQRSLKTIDAIKLLPAKEFPLDKEGIERFCKSWRSHFGDEKTTSSIYQDISSGKTHPGVEYYLPFFFTNTMTLFEYFPDSSNIAVVNDIEKSMQHFWHEVSNRYEQLRHDTIRPILPPQDLFITQDDVLAKLKGFGQIIINNPKHKVKVKEKAITNCFKSKKIDIKTPVTKNKLKEFPDAKILFTAKTLGRKEALLKILQDINILPEPVGSWSEFINSTAKTCITVAPISEPLHIIYKTNNEEVLIITEEDLVGEQTAKQAPATLTNSWTSPISNQKIEAIVKDLTELHIDDPVVHMEYGIGRYLGLKKLEVNRHESEFLELEYADNTKLYVPITSLNLISRYTGVDREHISLNHLGSKQWEKTKRQAKEKIRDTAVDLLEICARRLNTKGFSFAKPELEYDRFVKSFPFVVTPDQQKAIDDVITDMNSGRLMDRLICGDVGFGKTEVAMRAAFLAVLNGKQVAILAPTTLLAKQHFINFEERFNSWPVKIALLSRFGGNKDQKNVLENLANGKIDIVIGTHKLLQKNVRFNDLGLLVIDEEHRFGVRQKEHIKSLALNIDILALTATPIPRTLNMAFAGIRDFSIITTPPAKRLTIKTFRCEYEPYLIKEAVLREIFRGGQVYFLHNNITTIEKMANDLQNLAPEARIAIAHGQMRKKELEKIMNDFYHLKINVLVCTTIIESGIDVPTANTIIINRADRFGLAQLHQLRGRVGRSHHQAYAYLITPPTSVLPKEAKKRLDAITAMKDLGTGFVLATNDLEIRGAGELLGEKQSGVIQGIGFTLYMDMLKSAIKTIKGDKNIPEEDSKEKTEIDLRISALIPEQYIGDVNLRLVLYKRIADVGSQNDLDELERELIDRFGLLPEQTKNLFKITSMKLKAKNLGMVKIGFGVKKGIIEFKQDYQVDINVIIPLLQKHTASYKFSSANSIEFTTNENVSRIDFTDKLLNEWINKVQI